MAVPFWRNALPPDGAGVVDTDDVLKIGTVETCIEVVCAVVGWIVAAETWDVNVAVSIALAVRLNEVMFFMPL